MIHRNPALLLTALLATAAAPAGAQTPCYAENDDAAFEDGSSTGTAWFGIRFSPATSVTVSRAEVFTGETSAQHEVALWSHDAFNDQPLAALAQGFFGVTPTNAWQGADLSAQVPLQAGQTYWMVWGTTAGSQSSILPPQAVPGQVIRVSLDGGQSWGPQIQANERHFKFRLFCGCSGPAASYGQGCAGTGGLTPTLNLDVCPLAGQSVSISIGNALGGASALLLFGAGQTQTPIGFSGCDLLVAPLLPVVLTIPLSGAGPGGGGATLVGNLPANASGLVIEMQSLVLDPGGAAPGFAATNGIELKVP